MRDRGGFHDRRIRPLCHPSGLIATQLHARLVPALTTVSDNSRGELQQDGVSRTGAVDGSSSRARAGDSPRSPGRLLRMAILVASHADTDPASAKWLLERRCGARWRMTQKVDLTPARGSRRL